MRLPRYARNDGHFCLSKRHSALTPINLSICPGLFFAPLVQPSIADILRKSERLSERAAFCAAREFSERAKCREAQGTRAAGKPSGRKTSRD